MLKIGCCGFPKNLRSYSQNLSVVEVQKTFYSIPSLNTVKKWRENVKEEFEFTIKAPQYFTHPSWSPTYKRSDMKFKEEELKLLGFFQLNPLTKQIFQDLLELSLTLNAKLLVFQTPPSFSETEENVKNLYQFFDFALNYDFIYLWEVRGDWGKETLKKIFRDLPIIHVVDPFKEQEVVIKQIRYFRLHGRKEKSYSYSYTEEELEELLDMINPELPQYVMFNNTDMYRNALKLKELASQKGYKVI